MIDADYHESKECGPLLYALGMISIEWNYVEQMMTALIWCYVGDVDRGLAVTANIGNQSRADMLLALCKKSKVEPDMLDRVEFSTKAFNMLREKRNILIHSHSITPHESGKPEWRRASGKAPLGHIGTLADENDLKVMLSEIVNLSSFLLSLVVREMGKKHDAALSPMPDKFALPRKLTQLPPEALPTDSISPR